MHGMGKAMNELHAMLKLHEDTLPKEDANPALHAIRAGMVQKNQKNKPHKAAKGGHGKGKSKMGYAPNNTPFAPKPKIPPPLKKDNPVKDAICHQCGEIEYWRKNCPMYLAELMKKKKLSQRASTSVLLLKENFKSMPANKKHMHLAWPLWSDLRVIPTHGKIRAQMTTSVGNNSVFRSFFEKQKLTGPNFIDWYRQLRLVLSTEDKENYLEHPILEAPVAPPGQQVPPAAATTYAAWVKGQKEVDVLIFLTMDLDIQRNLAHLGAYDMLQELKAMFSKQAEQELLQTVREFNACKQEEEHWRKNCPMYLAELMKKKKLSQRANTSGSKKLKPGALSLYVGDGHRAAAEAIRTYHLDLPSRLVIVLNNCHYAPSITRDVISVSKNNLVYFMVVSEDGIFEIDVSCSNTKDGSMIIAHRTPPYTPQHNGVSKRRNRTLLDMVRSMMSQTTLPKSFWDYSLETVARILNMVFTKKGCEALVKRDTLTKPDMLDPRSFKCIFVGYPKETIGYSFYNPSENKVFVAWNAEFFENDLIDLKASGSVEDLKLIQEEDTNPFLDTTLDHEENDQEVDEPQSDINPIQKSSRTRRAPDHMCLYIDAEEHELGDLGEPGNYKAALLDPESKKWLDAMNVEMQSMKYNDVWVLVEFFPTLEPLGFTQTYGVDYEKTFASVADIRATRILIAVPAYYDYEIWLMDVKTVFLNGHLSKEVYMEKPKGFVNPKYPNHASGSYASILILYVDDILIMGNNIPMLQDVKSYLRRSFAMKDLGDVAYILGIKIYRD
nr:hypothetical protein [Tanacetum cinerariifolium]